MKTIKSGVDQVNIKRSIRKNLNQLLKLAPRELRQSLFRQMLHLPIIPQSNILVKFAESPDEFNQAFRLIQETYAHLGYCDRSTPMRATKYHTLPTTKVVIILLDGKVIATITHILDNPMGLPIENQWSIQALREQGHLSAEISSLAISKQWRHNHGLLHYMTRFLLDYAINHLGVDTWVIVTHPSTRDFYQGVLCFQTLSEDIKHCGHVKNALGLAQMLDLNQLQENFFRLYRNRPPHQNIHDFYFVRDFSNCFQFPTPSIFLTNSMPRFYFKELFTTTTPIISDMSCRERLILSGLYSDLVDHLGLPFLQNLRLRSLTSISGQLRTRDALLPVRVADVSSGGAKILSKFPLPLDHSPIRLMLPLQPKLEVPIRIVWNINQRVAGVQICDPAPSTWLRWTEDLRRQFQTSMLTRVA